MKFKCKKRTQKQRQKCDCKKRQLKKNILKQTKQNRVCYFYVARYEFMGDEYEEKQNGASEF